MISVNKIHKSEKLLLTPEQQKAFNRMRNAYDKCKSLGIVFVGFDEYHHALNGNNIVDIVDYNPLHYALEDDEINFNDIPDESNYILIEEPYIGCDVKIKIKE